MALTNLFIDALSNNQFTDLYNKAEDYSNLVQSYSQEIWNREDSAYQRMVADMKKAGLNPWTGISSGGSPTSSVNPAMDKVNTLISTFDNYLGYANSVRQFFGTGSQIANDTYDSLLKTAKVLTRALGFGFLAGM